MTRHDSPPDLCSHEEDPAEALRAALAALLPGDEVGELLLKAFAYGYLTEVPHDAPGLSAFIRGPLRMALATSHNRETAHRVVSSLASDPPSGLRRRRSIYTPGAAAKAVVFIYGPGHDRAAMSHTLRSGGCEVLAADTLDDGIALVARTRPALVIVGAELDGCGAEQIIARLRQTFGEQLAPVLVVSPDAQATLPAGAAARVTLPRLDAAPFLREVRRLLQGAPP